jgi:ubiquinone/menaquinone biosynthesis C-methylase UbiE
MNGRRWRNGVFGLLAGVLIIEAVRRRIATREFARRARSETERVRARYERIATQYDRFIALTEPLLLGNGRAWIAAEAHGDVLEIAIGTGRNLPYYSREVRLTGQDISPAMLQIARERARALQRHVDLRIGDAQALEFADESFDTVVSTLALCTIPDDRRAIAEAKRVLRRGGRFVALEHVRSPNPLVRLIQRVLDPVFCWLAADHLLREPVDHLHKEGLVVERLERQRGGLIERLTAVKPSGRNPDRAL